MFGYLKRKGGSPQDPNIPAKSPSLRTPPLLIFPSNNCCDFINYTPNPLEFSSDFPQFNLLKNYHPNWDFSPMVRSPQNNPSPSQHPVIDPNAQSPPIGANCEIITVDVTPTEATPSSEGSSTISGPSTSQSLPQPGPDPAGAIAAAAPLAAAEPSRPPTGGARPKPPPTLAPKGYCQGGISDKRATYPGRRQKLLRQGIGW